MRGAMLALTAGLCAGALLSAQVAGLPPAEDVKVVARVESQVAGTLGALSAMANRLREPVFATLTTRGSRLASTWRVGADAMSARPVRAEIVDFSSQITNNVLYGSGVYTQIPFADLRRRAAEGHGIAIAIKQGEDMFAPADGIAMPSQSAARAKRFDHIAQTQETGQTTVIAGVMTRQMLLSVRVWDHTKSLEDNGGWVVTADLWVGPRTPALDRLVAMQRDYARTINKGVYDAVFTSVELPEADSLDAVFPELMPVAARVVAEIGKIDGTVFASRTNYELARSAKEMTAAVRAYQAMERTAGKKVTPDPSELIARRERMVTTAFEYVAIDYAVTNLDVEVPQGFTLNKR